MVRKFLSVLARALLVGGPVLGALLAAFMGMTAGTSGGVAGFMAFAVIGFWGVVLGGALTLLVSIDARLEQLTRDDRR